MIKRPAPGLMHDKSLDLSTSALEGLKQSFKMSSGRGTKTMIDRGDLMDGEIKCQRIAREELLKMLETFNIKLKTHEISSLLESLAGRDVKNFMQTGGYFDFITMQAVKPADNSILNLLKPTKQTPEDCVPSSALKSKSKTGQKIIPEIYNDEELQDVSYDEEIAGQLQAELQLIEAEEACEKRLKINSRAKELRRKKAIKPAK